MCTPAHTHTQHGDLRALLFQCFNVKIRLWVCVLWHSLLCTYNDVSHGYIITVADSKSFRISGELPVSSEQKFNVWVTSSGEDVMD